MNSGLLLTGKFTISNAQILARYAAQAYQTDDVICKATDTKASVTEMDDCWIIAFEGTKDRRQWVTDADFLWVWTKYGFVHKGFWLAWQSVKEDLLAMIGRPGLPVVVTGHSLGGALAKLCALELFDLGYDVKMVYTFGQPRVGCRRFRKAYNEKLGDVTWRIVNRNDLIPRLPGAFTGYRHSGQFALIDWEGRLKLNARPWIVAISDVLGLGMGLEKLDDVLINEHFMTGYIAALDGIKNI